MNKEKAEENSLKQEIHSYWTKRASGYSEYNQQELEDERRMKWKTKLLELIGEQFPTHKPEEIKVLDIGTGPGFFALLLSELGYQVFAIDCTEEMLKEARKNTGSYAEQISWYLGDVQEMGFAEESFDVLVTRNVTWNLEKPEQAYREWYRILKKGGVLFNFDADWYGHLFDEEKKKKYEIDRKNTAEQDVVDLNEGTDEVAMEKIARQVPLSQEDRPDWDIRTMKKAGFSDVTCDPEVWREVWGIDDIVNCSSSPLFLMTGKKERDAFSLGGLTAKAGEKKSGYMKFSSGKFAIPATILHGKRSGKTALISAGVHAAEYVGIQASMELAEKLEIENVAGTIVILKAVSLSDFIERKGTEGASGEKNLNRIFPGKENGTETEQLAYVIEHEIFPDIDYFIDLHSGDSYQEVAPYVSYAGAAEASVAKISRQMAEQVDVPYMIRSLMTSGGAYNYAASLGIPSILIKRGGMGMWTEEESRSTRRDVRNILCHLGIYLREKDYRMYYPLDVVDVVYQDASHGGLWYRRKKAGDMFSRGEILGEVRDFEGNILEISVAEYDGVVLYQTTSLQVVENGSMIAYGKIIRSFDDRKERIVHYWSKRSESFLDQRRAELHDSIAERWMKEIREHMPEGRKLRILDVGCGAGFFSILLSKLGHEVIGIDLTPEMIQNARILAAEEQAACDFFEMDAENPAFSDESFDMVISRNLTWTLPHTEHAYEEWLRVLKKGGVLLNFDANYGAEDSSDTRGLPKTHAHHMIGMDMLLENEEIKRQLPISSFVRPAWDLETLGKLGVQKFSIDLGISPKVYVKKDEFYNPAAMFLIAAEK